MIILVLILTQLVTLLALLWAGRTTGENALQNEAKTALSLLTRVTVDNTRAYLQAAASVVEINRALGGLGIDNSASPSQHAASLNSILNAIPQIDGASYTRPDGRFVFVSRQNKVPERRFLRIITPRPARQVTDGFIDPASRITEQRPVTSTYAPNTRPWFKLAMQNQGHTVWTPPYVFAASQLPGVTVASTFGDNGQNVMAIDIQLNGLARLLQHTQMSREGRAFIADMNGHAIAASRAWPVNVQGRLPTLAEVADPPLQTILKQTRNLNTTPFQTEETLDFRVNGERYAAVLRTLEVAPDMHWLVGVYAPQSDFTTELLAVYRDQLWFIGVFILLSSLLAWPLAFQVTRPLASLQRQATTDALTGLVNRASFLGVLHDELTRAALHPHELGVVILDLDGFKQVNDSRGHATGDEVLHAVAARLLSSVRAGDTLGRLGGDEFALLLKGDTRERVKLRVESIIHELTRHPVTVEQTEFFLGATAGLAFNDRQFRRGSAELLAAADKALMYGKRQAKGRVWLEGETHNTSFND